MRLVFLLTLLSLPILFGIASSPLLAETTPLVTWMIADSPPSYILDGPLTGQGISELEIAFLIQHLGDFQHRRSLANSARMWEEIAHRDGHCLVGAVMTDERKSIALFSRRPRLKANYRVIFKGEKMAAMAGFIGEDGLLDPMMLGDAPGLQGATAARPLPQPLAAELEQTGLSAKLQKRPQAGQVLHLLVHDRVDFALVNGSEARYFAELYPDDHFVSLGIRGLPALSETHIACSNGPVGRSVIEQIDQLLQNDANWGEFLAPMRRWSSSEEFAQALAAQPRR
jgi:uncharacterized protein (TIGR02285 family)